MASYFRQVPNFAYVSRNSEEKYISDYTVVKNLSKEENFVKTFLEIWHSLKSIKL